MPYPIIKADLEARLTVGEVALYSKGTGNVANDENVEEAIGGAWDSFVSSAANVFTRESIDALTELTLPKEAKLHIVSHACAILAAGSNHPERIDKWAEAAEKWRSWLAGGKVRCFDSILTPVGSATAGTDRLRIAMPASRIFDPDDPRGTMRWKDPLL
jgi:hypothetical protein